MKMMKKSGLALLLTSLTALAAFAVPSMASAAVWGVPNSNHSLDSTATSTNAVGTSLGWDCSSQHFGVHVRSPASSTLDVTAATWTGCHGTGAIAQCNLTFTATGLPWTATALTATSANINNVTANVAYSGTFCPWGTGTVFLWGTQNGGVWSAVNHSLTWSGGTTTGLKFGPTVGSAPFYQMNVSGVFADTVHTMTLT